MLELSGEVTSLKRELGSIGTGMKGVTDITSKLTIQNNFFTQPWEWRIKNASFLHGPELDTITEMNNGKLLFLLKVLLVLTR